MSDLAKIFMIFFKIGTLTFGGGYTMLPILQRDIVQKLGWATGEEIIDFYAISQSLPGIVAANTSMLIGYKVKRIPGLLAAVFGIACPSLIIILLIAIFIRNFLDLEIIRHAFNGIRVAVSALIADAAIKMWKGCVKDSVCVVIFLIALAVFTFADISPIIPVVAGALTGVALKRERGRL
ncbi:MAG: chromate transporter [Synergistaceae bacterium]|jgi:chromate transporter|nr:chromate transporter [Synergistaceae bacterium]